MIGAKNEPVLEWQGEAVCRADDIGIRQPEKGRHKTQPCDHQKQAGPKTRQPVTKNALRKTHHHLPSLGSSQSWARSTMILNRT